MKYLYIVDRNTRIENLQKLVGDLVRQRQKLQLQETRLHDQYERVSQYTCIHTYLKH